MISLMARIKIVDELKLVERLNEIESRVKMLEDKEGKSKGKVAELQQNLKVLNEVRSQEEISLEKTLG